MPQVRVSQYRNTRDIVEECAMVKRWKGREEARGGVVVEREWQVLPPESLPLPAQHAPRHISGLASVVLEQK